ncbi:MAG: B12-binding domain-containing radical SAM protein [Reyranella sp.]
MRTRVIHLINPKTDSLTTRPLYLNRALYSPLAGLLAVAASIPRDQYDVVLTDENIETIDFDLKADLVGISAMTSYVNRGYEIADQFRSQGIPVVMGGVHPSFMPQEALKHCDAVVIGEVELVIDRLLDDLARGAMRGTYRADKLHPMAGMPMPRYDLLKKHRYVNRTFVQTSRGCHHGCTFCA